MNIHSTPIESCTSYAVCGLTLHLPEFSLHDINWATVGASVLLVARLIKDVPEAIEAIQKYWKNYKNKHGKGN